MASAAHSADTDTINHPAIESGVNTTWRQPDTDTQNQPAIRRGGRAGANSGPELDFLANSNSGIGIELAFPSDRNWNLIGIASIWIGIAINGIAIIGIAIIGIAIIGIAIIGIAIIGIAIIGIAIIGIAIIGIGVGIAFYGIGVKIAFHGIEIRYNVPHILIYSRPTVWVLFIK